MTQLASNPPIKMMIDDIQETRALVDSLLKTKHYQRYHSRRATSQRTWPHIKNRTISRRKK